MRDELAEDGRHAIITWHQSDLKEYLLCPERARRKWLKLVDDGPSDATAIGTAVHAGIEIILRGGSEEDAIQATRGAFFLETQHEHYRWVQVKKTETALRHVDTAFGNWMDFVYPLLGPPVVIEHRFDEHLCWLDDVTEIRLAGTIDFADPMGLWDWKTAKNGRKYSTDWPNEGWQMRRWDVQSTVYTWAANRLGILDDPWTFNFAAVSKLGREHWLLTVERGPEYEGWLRELAINASTMWLSDLPEWPKIDQHALCAPEWCPAWSTCKGSAIANVSHPVGRVSPVTAAGGREGVADTA